MLKGKTVLITGAAGGLGRAMSRKFVEQGAQVVALDLSLEGLASLVDQFPEDVKAFPCDITNEEACRGVAEKVGAVDIVINNAGITHFSRFEEMVPETIRKVMAVNFFGSVNITKAFLPGVVARKGSIVAISSVAGFSPLYGRCGYSASKHAMQGFFDSLRSELRDKGVHVMVASPSYIASQSDGGVKSGETARPGAATQTAGKPLQPEEAAEALILGLKKRKAFLPVGRLAKKAYWVSRFFPSIYEGLMVKKTKTEFS